MKFSLDWLGDFLDIQAYNKSPQDLASTLTKKGFEVEEIEDLGGQWMHVVVGEIKSSKQHPNADRLSLCEVWDGSDIRPIVCGAKNYKVGDKVALALPGAKLPNGLKIKKSKIRGAGSEGMLASEEELGLATKSPGIMILDSSLQAGCPLSEALGKKDVLMDISITPNRADCFSHQGLARELAACLKLKFSNKTKPLQASARVSVKKHLPISVKAGLGCQRYTSRIIKNVRVSESPTWLQERLKKLQKTPRNSLVDVTNYILLDQGQPMHVFDLDKISSIQVDNSKKGETFQSLDDETLTLTGKELVIRDGKKVLALAGVMGGKDSGVSSSTKNILLESACFLAESVRSTSRRFGLQTDSSLQFARGIDKHQVKNNLDRACQLITELAGGEVSKDVYDIYFEPVESQTIHVKVQDVSQRLGMPVDCVEFKTYMRDLGCKVVCRLFSKNIQVTPPRFRQDLKIREDLIEEFARLKGYDKIPQNPPTLARKPQVSSSSFLYKTQIEDLVKQLSWNQTLHYSFTDEDFYRDFLKDASLLEKNGLYSPDTFSIKNPISSNLAFMRPFLLPDMLKTVLSNYRNNSKHLRLFEVGTSFYKRAGKIQERKSLCLACLGEGVDFWKTSPKPKNVFQIRSSIDMLLRELRIKNWSWKQEEAPSFFHPKQCLTLYVQKTPIGMLGSLHPSLKSQYKMPLDLALAEINLDLLQKQARNSIKCVPPSPYLRVERDLCFTFSSEVSVGEIQDIIQQALPACEEIRLFDIYKKGKERSASFRLFLTPRDKVWTDEDLNKLQNQAIEAVKSKLPVRLK